jgi:hypothetical protein
LIAYLPFSFFIFLGVNNTYLSLKIFRFFHKNT